MAFWIVAFFVMVMGSGIIKSLIFMAGSFGSQNGSDLWDVCVSASGRR
jgi:hypothetical protein